MCDARLTPRTFANDGRTDGLTDGWTDGRTDPEAYGHRRISLDSPEEEIVFGNLACIKKSGGNHI